MSGYLHHAYAESLREFGTPLELPRCGGWLLTRQIPQTASRDAMGCYPLFACRDWSQLRSDLEQLNDVICVSLVTDPFGDFDEDYLRECFPDVMKPFKEHFVIDLERPLESFVHPHHLRNVRKALQHVEVERCTEPLKFLDNWVSLYQTLIEKHDITGLTAFSRNSFAAQLSVPGITAFRAVENDGATAGMLLFYENDNRAYYHLGAYSNRGYEVGASFALFDYALRYFCSRQFKWLNLGAGAGAGNSDSGLTRFKRRWSNGVRTAYFCGRIFSADKYQQLVEATHTSATGYFPAYRAGEFR
jgi:hypothetical protein